MTPVLQGFRLAHLPRPVKIAIALYAVVLGFGYLTALVNLYDTYAGADGKAGINPDDVKLRLYGNRTSTTLESVIAPGGKMSQYLPEPGPRGQVIGWIHAGASQPGYLRIKTIFDSHCIRCHHANGIASFRPLTNYQEVKAVAQVDMGESTAEWSRTAHTHIPSMAMMYLALGLAFAFCGISDKIKIPVICLPFLAIILDFSSRLAAHYWPDMVHLVLLSGALIGLATGIMILTILYELWVWKPGTGYRET